MDIKFDMNLIDRDGMLDRLGASDHDIYVKDVLYEEPIIDIKEVLGRYWISVDDRLPEEKIAPDGWHDPSERVLICNCETRSLGVSRYWKNQKVAMDMGIGVNPWIDEEYINPTHWMPIPFNLPKPKRG